MQQRNLSRITVTLDPIDVELLDVLARFSGTNRSEELRGILGSARPVLQQLVQTFLTAEGQRKQLDEVVASAAAAELEALQPEVEALGRQFLGAMARIEGAQAADPRGGNTGVTPPPPTTTDDDEEAL